MFIPVTTFGLVFAMGRYNRFEFWDEGRSLGCSVFWDGPKRDVQLISSQSCSKKGVVFFLRKKSLTFQCLSSVLRSLIWLECLVIFFSGDNLWRKLLEDTCASKITTPAPQFCNQKPRNGIRVTVRCPSLTDSDDAECLQLPDFNKPLPGKHRFFPLFLAHWIVGFRMF